MVNRHFKTTINHTIAWRKKPTKNLALNRLLNRSLWDRSDMMHRRFILNTFRRNLSRRPQNAFSRTTVFHQCPAFIKSLALFLSYLPVLCKSPAVIWLQLTSPGSNLRRSPSSSTEPDRNLDRSLSSVSCPDASLPTFLGHIRRNCSPWCSFYGFKIKETVRQCVRLTEIKWILHAKVDRQLCGRVPRDT